MPSICAALSAWPVRLGCLVWPQWPTGFWGSSGIRFSPSTLARVTRTMRSASQFRLPNLVRDLFAEGAMSAAFVPTFTRELTAGQPRALRLANSVITALMLVTGALVMLGMCSPNHWCGSMRAGSRPCRASSTHRSPHAPHDAVSDAGGAGRGFHGDVEHDRPLLRACLSPAMFNVALS